MQCKWWYTACTTWRYCRHRLQVVEEVGQVLLKVLQQLGEAVWTSYATTLSFRLCDRLSRPTRRSCSLCFRYSMFNIDFCGFRVLHGMEFAVIMLPCPAMKHWLIMLVEWSSYLILCSALRLQPEQFHQQTTGVTSQSCIAGTGKTKPRASANDQLQPGRVSAHDQ